MNAVRVERGPEDRFTRDALADLIGLYAAWGKPDKAAEYRALLREAEKPAAPV